MLHVAKRPSATSLKSEFWLRKIGSLARFFWLVLALCGTVWLMGCPQRTQVRRQAVAPRKVPTPRLVPTRRTMPPPPRQSAVVRKAPIRPVVRPTRRPPPVRYPPRPRRFANAKRNQTSRHSYYSFNAYRFYLRGQMHAVEGRSKEAVLAFKSALVYHPKSVFLRQRIALQFYKSKMLVKARFWALQALKFRRQYAPAYFLLGKISIDRRKLKEALRYFGKAIAKAPKYADAYLALNKALRADPTGQPKRIKILKKMIRHLPGRFEGYYQLAHLRQNQGRVKQAMKLYRLALDRQPSHHASLFQLAHLYEQKKQWKKAAKAYRVLLDYQPNSWQTRVTIACLYLKHGEKQDAQLARYHFRYIMREATQISAAERSYHIGSGLMQCRAYTHAIKWLKRAMKLRNNYSIAHLTMGLVYVRSGKPKQALPLFRAVSPKERGIYVEAQTHLLQVLLKLKQNKQAWLALERARIQLARHPNDWIRLSQLFAEHAPVSALAQEVQQLRSQMTQLPNHKGLMHQLSFVYFKQKKFADCERVLLRILQKDAKHTPSLNFLGYLYAVLGRNLPKAERLVKKALKLSPKNPYYLDSLGWIYYRRGALRKARKVLELALRQLPEDTTILMHLGQTYHRQRLWKRARKMYDKAKQLKPPQHLMRKIDDALQKLKRRRTISAAKIAL